MIKAKSIYNEFKEIISCFDIGEVPRSPSEVELELIFAIHFHFQMKSQPYNFA